MRKPLTLLLLVLSLPLAGCAFLAGAAVVTAGVVYVQGEAKKIYPVPLDPAFQATTKAMESLDLVILEQKHDGAGWYLRSRRPFDAAEVHVRVVPSGEHASQVGVRVGVTGDRVYSERLLEAIDQCL